MSLPYDNEVGGGWGPFKLPKNHPFTPAFKYHDEGYDPLIAKTADYTLKQLDQRFLNIMLKIAWREKWFGNTYLPPLLWQAWSFYRIARWWAKYERPELEAYRPTMEEK